MKIDKAIYNEPKISKKIQNKIKINELFHD